MVTGKGMNKRLLGRLDRLGSTLAFVLSFGLIVLVMCAAPVIALADEEPNHWGVWEDVGRWFNLLLLGGGLAWLLRKPLKSYFAGRNAAIRDELRSSAEAYQNALAAKAAMEEKIRHIDEDLARIRKESEKNAEAEGERIRQQTAKDAERLVENARREINNLTRTAQKELREYAAKLTVDLAEKRIRGDIKPQDERRVEEVFFKSLGEPKQGEKPQ
jgi:F-type H+-transporting ATPase subunit b